jgi:RNA polymerase primary sigma factor/RNA polymerase sigma factor
MLYGCAAGENGDAPVTTTYRTQLIEGLRKAISELETPALRLQCSIRAESLMTTLRDEMTYAPADLTQEILAALPGVSKLLRMRGDSARHDLRLLVEDLTEETMVPVEEVPEPVFTTDELAGRWNVSLKTVSRWRERGLVARKFIVDGRPRVGFLQSSIVRFADRHPKVVRRGRQFSRMRDNEREDILRRARQMLDGLVSPSEVVAKLAADTQRSSETIRQLLKQAGLLSNRNARELSPGAQQQLYRKFRSGKSIAWLANRFGQTRTKVRKCINRQQAERILELPLEYMPSDEFTQPNAEGTILQPMPANPGPVRTPRKPADLPSYIASLYDVPLLTPEQETHAFRKYNFLKFKASMLRKSLNRNRPSTRTLDQIENLYDRAIAVNNQIVRANLRLVVAVAKKYVGPTGDLFEKVSEGNESLMRAVEKFDYTRGFKFSTYATWAIKKNFIRAYSTSMKLADRFRTGHEELLDTRIAYRANPHVELAAQERREEVVAHIMRHLSDRERNIIRSRFGMGPGAEPKTLQEVGDELGVSKERVRQLESRAMTKLREAADNTSFDDELVYDQSSYLAN